MRGLYAIADLTVPTPARRSARPSPSLGRPWYEEGMSLIVAAVAAAGVGLAAGAIAVGSWLRRRSRSAEAEDASPPPATAEAASAAPRDRLTVGLDDMVQVDEQTRWLCSGLRVSDGASLRCALWFASEGQGQLLVVAFPPPDQHIYWLARTDLAVPATPPSRLDAEGRLLDRIATFPAYLEPVRTPPLSTDQAVISWYEGAVGDAAVTVHDTRGCAAYVGRRIHRGDYERMGTVAPEDEPRASTGAT